MNCLHSSKFILRLRKAFLALLFWLGVLYGQGIMVGTLFGLAIVPEGEPYDALVPHTDQELNEALQLVRVGDMDAAIKLVDRYLETHFDSAAANEIMGIALAKQGKLEEGAKCFQRAIAINPRQNSAITKLGDVYLAQRNVALAKCSSYRPSLWIRRTGGPINVWDLSAKRKARFGRRRASEKRLIGTPADYRHQDRLAACTTSRASLKRRSACWNRWPLRIPPRATRICSGHGLAGPGKTGPAAECSSVRANSSPMLPPAISLSCMARRRRPAIWINLVRNSNRH